MASNSAMQFGSVAYEKDPHDYYCEPRWVVEDLADVESFWGAIWDPAAGSGNIPNVFRDRNHTTISTDIVNRGGHIDRVDDFLNPKGQRITRVDNIVTNPPYTLAEKFARQALKLARRKVAVLVSLTFLESQKRKPFFNELPPTRVWVCSKRPSMPPGGLGIEAKGGKRPYCWVVWDMLHMPDPGRTDLRWL